MLKFNFHSADTCQLTHTDIQTSSRHTHIMFCVNKCSRLGDRYNNVGIDDIESQRLQAPSLMNLLRFSLKGEVKSEFMLRGLVNSSPFCCLLIASRSFPTTRQLFTFSSAFHEGSGKENNPGKLVFKLICAVS